MTDFKAIGELKEKVKFLEFHNHKRLLKELVKSEMKEMEKYLEQDKFEELEGTAEIIITHINQYLERTKQNE